MTRKSMQNFTYSTKCQEGWMKFEAVNNLLQIIHSKAMWLGGNSYQLAIQTLNLRILSIIIWTRVFYWELNHS